MGAREEILDEYKSLLLTTSYSLALLAEAVDVLEEENVEPELVERINKLLHKVEGQ